jgi:hypothetical protein
MKWISGLGLAAVLALGTSVALAQDFSAGKTPAQLFGSDCSACHRAPGGLAGNRDVRTLTAFLRQHYTTNPDSAGTLAAYVSGFAGTAAPRPAAVVGTSATGDDSRTAARPGENPARRRRTTEMSGDGEKRRREDAAAPPRPAGAPAAGNGATPLREPLDPLVRLRAYATSGLGYESVAAEAAKARPADAHHSEEAPPAAGGGDPVVARTGADAPDVNATPSTVPPAPSGVVARNPAVQVRRPLPR